MSLRPSLRSRRRLLLGGAVATLGGAAAVATSTEAQAAGAAPVLVGRSSAGGARTTSLIGAGGRAVWQVVQRGAGVGAAVHAQATAFLAVSGLASGWGVHGRSAATRAGTGGAVRAEGRRNAGLLADTTVQDVPAVVAIGGNGAGVALVATGQSYLDGDALALRSWTGVIGADGVRVAYAPAVSAEAALHTATGHASLDGAGTATVLLPSSFTAAVDTLTLTVSLTAVDVAMPSLAVGYRQEDGAAAGVRDAFTVTGGSGGGTVAWTAWATRRAVDLQKAQLAAGRTAATGVEPGVEPGGDAAWERSSQPSRRRRGAFRLPSRD